MMQRLREMLASGLVAVAVLVVLWWVLRRLIGLVAWLVNLAIVVAVVFLLLAAARRLRQPKKAKF